MSLSTYGWSFYSDTLLDSKVTFCISVGTVMAYNIKTMDLSDEMYH